MIGNYNTNQILILKVSTFIFSYNNSTNDSHDKYIKEINIQGITNVTVFAETGFARRTVFTKQTWCNSSLLVWQKAIVPFKIQGNILTVDIRNGQQVSAGDLLARLDNYHQQQNIQLAQLINEQAQPDFEAKLIVQGYKVNNSIVITPSRLKIVRLHSNLLVVELNLNKALRELQNAYLTALAVMNQKFNWMC